MRAGQSNNQGAKAAKEAGAIPILLGSLGVDLSALERDLL